MLNIATLFIFIKTKKNTKILKNRFKWVLLHFLTQDTIPVMSCPRVNSVQQMYLLIFQPQCLWTWYPKTCSCYVLELIKDWYLRKKSFLQWLRIFTESALGPLRSSSRDVCLYINIGMYVPFHCNFFRGLSLALR